MWKLPHSLQCKQEKNLKKKNTKYFEDISVYNYTR